MLVRYKSANAKVNIDLYNVLGGRVMNMRGNIFGETVFDVRALRTGMYLLALRNGASSATRTVMIVR